MSFRYLTNVRKTRFRNSDFTFLFCTKHKNIMYEYFSRRYNFTVGVCRRRDTI